MTTLSWIAALEKYWPARFPLGKRDGYGEPRKRPRRRKAVDREHQVEIMAERFAQGVQLHNAHDSWRGDSRLASEASRLRNGTAVQGEVVVEGVPAYVLAEMQPMQKGQKVWEFNVPGYGLFVRRGYTKGEAIKSVKVALGIGRKGRLPIGYTARLLTGSAANDKPESA